MAPLTLDPPRAEDAETEALRLARRNLAANRAAIERRQPALVETVEDVSELTWLFARDGYLTAMDAGDRRWHAGCSVPLLAARAVLKTLDRGAGVACFLNPAHAAQVRVVLDLLEPSQAVICAIPDPRTLAVMLRCDDFSAEIGAGRLWFVAGEGWTAELSNLFDAVPGLATPSRFIRVPGGDAALVDGMIVAAQRVFAEQNTERTARIAQLRSNRDARPEVAVTPRTVCVIARSMFRLWDDAGQALLGAVARDGAAHGFTCRHFDPDAPAESSPLALASVVAESDAVLAADVARSEVAALVHPDVPVITWVTAGRVPPFHAAGPRDRLLLADARWREGAKAVGWPGERVASAGWPMLSGRTDAPTESHLAIIADTFPLDPPKSLREYSSHLLLWEKIRRTISRDPFALPEDIDGWLREQARADAVAIETLDVPFFVNRLIVPAYQQSLADALIRAGVPLKLHGNGWAEIPAFRDHAAGPVASRDDLHAAARAAAGLVHPFPGQHAGAIDAFGRPVVRSTGGRRETFVREATLVLKNPRNVDSPSPPSQPGVSAISAELIAKMLHR